MGTEQQFNEQIPNASGVPTTFDASADFVSGPLEVKYYGLFSVQMTVVGTPVGALTLQGSNDPGTVSATGPAINDVTNWTTIANSSAAVNGAGTVMYNYQNSGFRWTRVVYTSTSGTGTMTGRYNTKGE